MDDGNVVVDAVRREWHESLIRSVETPETNQATNTWSISHKNDQEPWIQKGDKEITLSHWDNNYTTTGAFAVCVS